MNICLFIRRLNTTKIAPPRQRTRREQNGTSHRLHTQAAKPPPAYSQAVKAAGLVFVSGTAPTDPATGAFKGTTIQEQTRQCLTNIQAILEEAGSSMDKIVSATIVLADEDDFAGMNEEWLKWFPTNPPARQGTKLPVRIAGLKVSIAAIAEA
jgi:2-iminobutanoate/2-iminopropanoate deaminase